MDSNHVLFWAQMIRQPSNIEGRRSKRTEKQQRWILSVGMEMDKTCASLMVYFELFCEAPDGGRFEQHSARHGAAEHPFQFEEHFQSLERISPRTEKIIVDTNILPLEEPPPHCQKLFLQSCQFS